MPDTFDDLLELMRGRRSIRSFRPDPVDAALVQKLLEAARSAPSASNRQPFRFLVIADPQRIAELAGIVEQEIERLSPRLRAPVRDETVRYLRGFLRFAGAPLLLVALHRTAPSLLGAVVEGGVEDAQRRGEADALASVSAAIMQLLLAAHCLGLGGCWMTGPLIAEPALAGALSIPEGWALSAFLPIGYPAESPSPPRRRPVGGLLLPMPPRAED